MIELLKGEVVKGSMDMEINKLKEGIGKIENEVLKGFEDNNLKNMRMYREVLKDRKLDMLDEGKMDFE